MEKRRTNPSFLSNDEAAREARRTEEVVRRLTGEKPKSSNIRRNVRTKQFTNKVRWTPINKVTLISGETVSFSQPS